MKLLKVIFAYGFEVRLLLVVVLCGFWLLLLSGWLVWFWFFVLCICVFFAFCGFFTLGFSFIGFGDFFVFWVKKFFLVFWLFLFSGFLGFLFLNFFFWFLEFFWVLGFGFFNFFVFLFGFFCCVFWVCGSLGFFCFLAFFCFGGLFCGFFVFLIFSFFVF